VCNENQDPIPHAPCTVTQGGNVIHAEADEDGIVTLQVQKSPNLLMVEWSDPASGHTGTDDHTFSLDVYIFPGDDDAGTTQRLHNVGYSEDTSLEEKVRSFQREFNRPVTGTLSDEERGELIRWHDGGEKPAVQS